MAILMAIYILMAVLAVAWYKYSMNYGYMAMFIVYNRHLRHNHGMDKTGRNAVFFAIYLYFSWDLNGILMAINMAINMALMHMHIYIYIHTHIYIYYMYVYIYIYIYIYGKGATHVCFPTTWLWTLDTSVNH